MTGPILEPDFVAELLATRDLYNAMLAERARWERDVRAAARRHAFDEITAFAHLHVPAAINDATLPLTGLCYRVLQLGRTAGQKQVADLKAAATMAEAALQNPLGGPDEAVAVAAALRAEVTRLRELIGNHARTVHLDGDGQRPCRCDCCELIRDMDTLDGQS